MFRPLKRLLISTKSVKKYVLYAFGEMFLVVLGILIAIQINSFYNHKIFEKNTNQVLIRLKDEIQSNIKRLNYLEFESRNTSINYIVNLQLLDSMVNIVNRGIIDKDLNFMVHNDHFNRSTYNLQNSVYNEMLNTGQLYTLNSAEIINAINSYYTKIERDVYYHDSRVNEVIKLKNECKYGWNNFKPDYIKSPVMAIESNSWLFDAGSHHYIDLRMYLLNAQSTLERSKLRISNIRKQSFDLINKIDELAK